MNVLAIQSSGDQTSVSVIYLDDVISFSINHKRKDRPDWNNLLSNIGLNSTFKLTDIDLFSYANSSGSYTATRSVASFMKGITTALKKPLIAVKTDETDKISADQIAKHALVEYSESGFDHSRFMPNNANPVYASITQYKKINE